MEAVREFRIGSPERLRRTTLAALMALAGAGILAALVLDGDPSASDLAAGALAAGAALAAAAWFLRRTQQARRTGVVVGDQGLATLDPGTPERRLAWRDVLELRVRRIPGAVRAESVGGAIHIDLEFGLADFEELLGVVLRETPQANPAHPLPARFDHSHAGRQALAWVLSGIGCAAGAALLFQSGAWWPAAGVAGCYLLFLWLSAVSEPWRIEVSEGAVVVASALRRRTIRADEVADVRLHLRDVGNDQKVLDVSLALSNGKSLRVRPPGVDRFALYRTLVAALLAEAG